MGCFPRPDRMYPISSYVLRGADCHDNGDHGPSCHRFPSDEWDYTSHSQNDENSANQLLFKGQLTAKGENILLLNRWYLYIPSKQPTLKKAATNLYLCTPRPDSREPQSHTRCLRDGSAENETLGLQVYLRRRSNQRRACTILDHENMPNVRTKATRKGRCGTTYLDHENMLKALCEWKPGAVAEPQPRRGRGAGRRRSQSGCRLGGSVHICDGYQKRQTCSGREEVGPHGMKTPADLRRGR
eukprot:6214764-Pleurochrysis_carterae.AAC.1